MLTPRERIMQVLRRQLPDRVPLGAYSFLLPRGTAERKVREKGCGIVHFERVYATEMQNVEISTKEKWENNEKTTIHIYRTPLGDLYEKTKLDPGYRSQWTKEFMIKKPSDYRIAKYIIENTVYHQNYEFFVEVEKNIGEDGILIANMDRTPLQRTLIELTGTERLCIDLYERADIMEEFFDSLRKKQDEMYQIAADSPAQIIHNWDNLTEDITEPRLFQKYCLPLYNKYGHLLHERGKIYVVHMDGKLYHLKNLIKKAEIDVIESFTLPGAGGNLSLQEAKDVWKNKTIVANLPAFLCYKDEEFIKRFIRDLLIQVPKERFMLDVSEDLPQKFWRRTLPIVADAMQMYG
ncbi:hypothetical protein CEE35_07595 [Candidatus Aerophobetes bacterium Ae_b3b]|nr:MAG: hypothetical protein CEE35_07595 [Candidatus Aerophobetes bacterium Ae_b3b]